jgi:ribonuclease VapC
MVVDTSALVAIITEEDESLLFEDMILRTPTAVISVVSIVEATIVLQNKSMDFDQRQLDTAVTALQLDIRGVDLNQGELARQAYLRFGRGRSPAGLNFGDCFAYALAKARNDVLLFKGDDFAQTDIVPAWRPQK